MRLSEQGAPAQVVDNFAADEFIAAASEQRIVAFGMGATVTVIMTVAVQLLAIAYWVVSC